jgi:hypothetical protein
MSSEVETSLTVLWHSGDPMAVRDSSTAFRFAPFRSE